ncbi:MAG: bifunctional ADP-dependent NAD(P)H-hydrate dehydratase/NAD(P)H-hydrate epimerase, partial [Clostridiales bacterium]|nr:bifunctional ADP-dependent NAD(P)H-hydrate dehydratase/NAD(P)H-hydrate epimerase [Clostridiales bacterium]
MKYLVTGKEMSLYDRQTSEHFHVPSVVLMEQAAQAFVSRLMRIISESYAPDFNLHVLVVCGTGNNGGDGIAIARLLNQRGIYAEVYAPAEGRRTSELIDLQYQIYLAYGYPVSQG